MCIRDSWYTVETRNGVSYTRLDRVMAQDMGYMPAFHIETAGTSNAWINGVPVAVSYTHLMRLGEACGLRWDDIPEGRYIIYIRRTLQRLPVQDGSGKTALVFGPPKSASSARAIPVPASLRDLSLIHI